MVNFLIPVLVRIKLAVLRHELKGERVISLYFGLAFGAIAITATFWAGLVQSPIATLSADLLGIVLGMWFLGWIVAPILFGGEDNALKPEHFRFLPISSWQLAISLFGAAFVSVPVMITLLAFLALTVYAGQFGMGAVLVAIFVTLLLLVLTVISSRVTISILRQYTQSKWSAILGSLLIGAITAFFSTGWSLFVTLDRVMSIGFPDTISKAIRMLPTGWAITAIEAAHDGRWIAVTIIFATFVLCILLLIWVWSLLLRQRLTSKPVHNRAVANKKPSEDWGWIHTPLGNIVHKELLMWQRDFTRNHTLYFAFFYSLAFCLYPLAAGHTFALPFIGVLFAFTAASNSASLYAMDGSALWTTITTPNAYKIDVRGRQMTWTLITAPVALLATILPIAITGYFWALPGALALVLIALGSGAGIVVFYSIYRLTPMTDPIKRGDDIFDQSTSWTEFLVILVLLTLLSTPIIGLLILEVQYQWSWLSWITLFISCLLAIFYYWFFGRLAYKRLAAHGPELFTLMTKGSVANQITFKHIVQSLSPNQRKLLYTGIFLGPLLLLQQGLVPIGKILSNDYEAGIFLVLYAPKEWQSYAIASIMIIGLLICILTLHLYLVGRKRLVKIIYTSNFIHDNIV